MRALSAMRFVYTRENRPRHVRTAADRQRPNACWLCIGATHVLPHVCARSRVDSNYLAVPVGVLMVPTWVTSVNMPALKTLCVHCASSAMGHAGGRATRAPARAIALAAAAVSGLHTRVR